MIFQSFPIECHALVFFAVPTHDLFVETTLGLIAQPFPFHHLLKKSGNLQFAALVAHILRHVLNHVPENVEAYQIDRAKRS